MSAQPSLISEAIDSEVLKPSNENQWQVVRDRSAFPNGRYFAYDKDGNKEQIGGPGVGGQLSVDVTYNPLTRVLTALAAGGTVASYAWTMKSATSVVGELDETFASPVNAATATIALPGPAIKNGLATVKVTDTFGRITYGSFFVRSQVAL